MKNVDCNDSNLVCINHFNECDYKISSTRWTLNATVVPTLFNRICEVVDDENESETLEHITLKQVEQLNSTKKNEDGGLHRKLEQLQAEKDYWKDECIALRAQLVKTQEENNKLNLVSSNELAKLKVIIIRYFISCN